MIRQIKLRTCKYKVPVRMAEANGRLYFQFRYNKKLMAEIKAMSGAKYHGFEDGDTLVKGIFGTKKVWSVEDCPRNWFQLDFLMGGNPYERYDRPVDDLEIKFERPLYDHQIDLVKRGLTYRQCIWAAEMGTGKTLSAIEVMERSGKRDWFWVGPRSALRAVEIEFLKWNSNVLPEFMTYEGLVKRMKNWVNGTRAPEGIIFDECQKIKTPTAQRSQAAKSIADGMRSDHENPYVILMSGTPAPKAPDDWWHLCEVACPGFLREGTRNKLKNRLGLFQEKESFSGGVFQQRITWLDDENKCSICGQPKEDIRHSGVHPDHYDHDFKKSVNEVEKLYRRMKGLVTVKFKKDCLDLPEKQYRIIEVKPIPSVIRTAKLIKAKAKSAASALILLRELSDGFQYKEIEDGVKTCILCEGKKEIPDYETSSIQTCTRCGGIGEEPRYIRTVERIPCPKDDVLRDILDEHRDVGRLVVYAGFEGSISKCVEIAKSKKWETIKWDGKGIKTSFDSKINDPLDVFQNQKEQFERVCFIGQAGAAGTGLTLTASPTIFYYSNDFNYENRAQSEDRIHRIGVRDAQIIDCFHLPTDKYVYDNLMKKRKLQNMTLGDLDSILSEEPNGTERLIPEV